MLEAVFYCLHLIRCQDTLTLAMIESVISEKNSFQMNGENWGISVE